MFHSSSKNCTYFTLRIRVSLALLTKFELRIFHSSVLNRVIEYRSTTGRVPVNPAKGLQSTLPVAHGPRTYVLRTLTYRYSVAYVSIIQKQFSNDKRFVSLKFIYGRV